jgi:PQQ-dependent catabolism-associated CXXCW motif protein
MLQGAVVAVDVLPQPQRPPELPATTYWHPPARRDIPGSVWLANVGYGALSDEMNQYFQDALDNISLGDRARKLAFYCEAQCWMSWNAAKRALGYGYRSVYWFPGGVQEWRAAGYPTMLNAAIPLK